MIQKLELTQEDAEKISIIARDCKFEIRSTNLYHESEITQLLYFIKCYKFLKSISVNPEVNVDVKNKIDFFVQSIKPLHNEALEISFNMNDYFFGKHRKMKKLRNFIKDNHILFYETLSQCFLLGKKIQLFDPDDFQGLQ